MGEFILMMGCAAVLLAMIVFSCVNQYRKDQRSKAYVKQMAQERKLKISLWERYCTSDQSRVEFRGLAESFRQRMNCHFSHSGCMRTVLSRAIGSFMVEKAVDTFASKDVYSGDWRCDEIVDVWKMARDLPEPSFVVMGACFYTKGSFATAKIKLSQDNSARVVWGKLSEKHLSTWNEVIPFLEACM